ncbi:hypothetical protein B0H19DRAFT_1173724 [Mycena capillaripes]|nr:hypothetical protein B0H19DRAFT_1173724 [Mycena capillaripes]
MLWKLPQELIDAVLAELDVESLCLCALVCSQLLVPSQRLIFHSLVISYADIPSAQSLFAVASHISGYVRNLEIELEVSLSAQNRTVEWKHLNLPLQSAVYDVLASTDFHSLNLANIHDVPSSFIVQALSSIKRLGLFNITVAPSQERHFAHSNPRQTERLILRTMSSDVVLVNLILQGNLDNVRRLSLGIHQGTRAQALRLIAATTSVLRYLQLRCGVFQIPLDLPRLPILQAIELKLYFDRDGGFPSLLYAAIAAFPATTPAIEVVRLTFSRAWMFSEDTASWATVNASPFPLFDDNCAYREALPCLRRVHCHLCSEDLNLARDALAYRDFSAYMYGKFPGLRDTRILAVSVGGDEVDEIMFN